MHLAVRLFHAFCFTILFSLSHAFYIPGYSIKSYREGETIPLLVNKVYSDNAQLQYAYSELPFFCPPKGRRNSGSNLISGTSISLNLGEVLRGDRIMISDYELIMGEDQEARYLCSHKVDKAGLRRARELIKNGYVAEWIVDNLPGATSFITTDQTRRYYASGFKLGYQEFPFGVESPRYFINNHVTIVIRYRQAPGRDGQQGKKVIVGFEVYPKSIEAGHRDKDGLPEDIQNVGYGMELSITPNVTLSSQDSSESESSNAEVSDDDATVTIPYTYSVYFREDDTIEWANRWDMYFVDQEDSSRVHWLAIVCSLLISGALTTAVAVIFARTIRGEITAFKDKDILEEAKVRIHRRKGPRSPRKSMDKGSLLDQIGEVEIDTDVSSDDESIEELTGWKLVHGDVFRKPQHGGILAPLIGSGVQLIFMATGLILLSCVGILNPSFRGGYISVGIALFVIAGAFSGYFSGRVYRTLGGQKWQKNVIVTGTLVPGLLFFTAFILNLFVWAQASSTAIPFGTLIGLVALWLLIQLPLVYVGSWYGFVRVGAWDHPIKANAIPRQVPQQTWYGKDLQTVLIAGFVPFLVILTELLFVFKSLWQDKSGYYYIFGFLAVISVILILVVVEVTIISTYMQLCSENYHWWWRSFFVGSGSALWIFAFCVWYYFTGLHIQGFVPSLLFFGYSLMACAVYGLLTGTIGFLSAYAFVRRIYGAIKAD